MIKELWIQKEHRRKTGSRTVWKVFLGGGDIALSPSRISSTQSSLRGREEEKRKRCWAKVIAAKKLEHHWER